MGVEARNLDGNTERGLISGAKVGVPFVVSMTTVAATSSYDVWTPLPRGLKILDCWCYASGGAGGGSDTVKLTDGTNDITAAIDVNVADNTRAPVVSIDDAYASIAKGGTLNVTTASAAVARVHIMCEWTD